MPEVGAYSPTPYYSSLFARRESRNFKRLTLISFLTREGWESIVGMPARRHTALGPKA
jgi:hypothetical protein